MADMTTERRTATKIEQHLGTIVQAVMIALLIWTGQSLLSLREQVAVMRVELTALQLIIQQGQNNRYSQADASRDLARVYIDMGRLEKRMEAIENKLKDR